MITFVWNLCLTYYKVKCYDVKSKCSDYYQEYDCDEECASIPNSLKF